MTGRYFLGKVRRIHFVGIGGSGMNGIADVVLSLGFHVSGSDMKESETTQRLRERGADVNIGHKPENVTGASVLVKSTAVKDSNPEVREAVKLGIPVIPRAEMLAQVMSLSDGVAIAGSHGKTTTTSLVATVLTDAGLDPTVVIGGKLNQLGSSAKLGSGDYMVAEADESDGSFQWLSPTLAVVTNIDLEHVDYWTDGIESLQDAFVDFLNRLPFYGLAIVCIDSPSVRTILPRLKRRVLTYGVSEDADFKLSGLRCVDQKMEFDIERAGRAGASIKVEGIRVNLLGKHNALNAAAAFVLAAELGISFDGIAESLSAFGGVERRLTLRGKIAGVEVLDDYAHHPTELMATLSAVRDANPSKRIVVAFEPHRYSRTQAFLEEFAQSLLGADVVRLLPIYAAGEAAIPGATSTAMAARAIGLGHKNISAHASSEEVLSELHAVTKPGDIVITMGAGGVTHLGPKFLAALDGRIE